MARWNVSTPPWPPKWVPKESDQSDWDLQLPLVLWACHTMAQESSGFTSALLMLSYSHARAHWIHPSHAYDGVRAEIP
ncbi:hypothetical protein AOLI_G00101050 [Acnodon oligacanthus]